PAVGRTAAAALSAAGRTAAAALSAAGRATAAARPAAPAAAAVLRPHGAVPRRSGRTGAVGRTVHDPHPEHGHRSPGRADLTEATARAEAQASQSRRHDAAHGAHLRAAHAPAHRLE